jgi:hypothetical protein
MSLTIEISTICMNSLFILGVLLIPLGLSFLLIPDKTLQLSEKLNRWISTEHIFDAINKPRYQERLVYRHHHIFGILVMGLTALCLYMLLFYTDRTLLLQNLLLLADTAFGQWLLESLFYIFIGTNILAFIIGLIIFIRPSMLKTLEYKTNHWVDADKKLEILDTTREFPESIILKNPRIFGALVIFGAIWIIINTKDIFI